MNLAGSRKEHKPCLRWTRLLASTKLLEPGARLVVELPGEPTRTLLDMRGLPELAREGGGRDFRHFDARCVLECRVARHEDDVLPPPVLGSEALEHRVRIRRITHL